MKNKYCPSCGKKKLRYTSALMRNHDRWFRVWNCKPCSQDWFVEELEDE